MSTSASAAARPVQTALIDSYLDLMKKILTRVVVARGRERRTIYPDDGPKSRLASGLNQVMDRFNWEVVRLHHSSAEDYLESVHQAGNRVEDAETMLGTRQLDHMQTCIANVINQKIPGDFLEAGVWRGGMAIFMRAGLKAYQDTVRKVYLADSFAGLPEIDAKVETFDWHRGDMAVSLETVKSNFSRYDLLDDQVVFLKGFFADTLPSSPVNQLSILRIDADLYESTMDALKNLYPRLSPGGYAVFDDYQNLPDCRRAIDEYRLDHSIKEEICPIDKRAVYWRRAV